MRDYVFSSLDPQLKFWSVFGARVVSVARCLDLFLLLRHFLHQVSRNANETVHTRTLLTLQHSASAFPAPGVPFLWPWPFRCMFVHSVMISEKAESVAHTPGIQVVPLQAD